MRAATLVVAAVVLGAAPVAAQTSDGACQNQRALGVSRTIDIDTAGGPRFGHQQYKDQTILNDGEVVLTFDDGPLRPYTQPVLDALSAHCTRATFFMVGRMAAADPEMVREVVRRGHTIGTHTWSHRNLRTANPVNARQEIELGLSAVRRAAGQPIAPFFRFPYLSDPAHAQSYLKSRNLGMFSIEVDAYDYRTQSPATVHNNIMSQLKAQRKGILLFHDIQPSTARALRALLDDLKAHNFKVVHIVPKGQATTLAEFDIQVEREFSRRKVAVASQPLAPRSMVWPVAPPPPPVAPPTAAVVGAPPPAFAPQPAPAPITAPAPVLRPARERVGERSWQDRVFNSN